MLQQPARFLLYMKTGKCRYDIAKNKTGIRRKWHEDSSGDGGCHGIYVSCGGGKEPIIKTVELTRPFAFLIYDRSNDEILFSRKVVTVSK